MATVFAPEVLYAQGRLHRGGTLCVDAQGTVLAEAPQGANVVKLPGKLLLPGFVNGHSHAFQRVLRSRTEFLARGHDADDFWSWREAMYLAAHSLTPEELYAVSLQSFIEMALAGITTVCEFHYLHHQPDGTAYADPHLLSEQVIRAAKDAGLRIVLLRVVYARAGFQVPENPRQKRFIDASIESALSKTQELTSKFSRDAQVRIGLAPHSVRAVPRAWLEEIARSYTAGPIHVHASEQPAELKACIAEYGMQPVELLHACGLLGPRFTAVHAIHLNDREISLLGSTRSQVCACPSTERNLGDGVVPADALMKAGAVLTLGSDSQAHIDVLDELRQVEGHLRLQRLRRNVLTPRDGTMNALGALLLKCATENGNASAGTPGGTLAPGSHADFATVDLHHPALAGVKDESLLTAVALGAPSAVLRDVFVGGRPIVTEGRHALAEVSAREFSRVIDRLAAGASA